MMTIQNQMFESTSQILAWITERNANVNVEINRISLEDCTAWQYDANSGMIINKNNSFFKISGIKSKTANDLIEQPIILQDEIGYLGIIRQKINGEYHYLMQAKIEPGNINHIQISPTIQATKSNFTQKHGGKKPLYLDYFLKATPQNILVDQIQSEQSSRFLKKRNRNIIITLAENEEIETFPSHKWLTLSQVKELMTYDNIVNMDTRTVFAGIPYFLLDKPDACFTKQQALYKSMIKRPSREILVKIYRIINNYKMFNIRRAELCALFSLRNWQMKDKEFVCNEPYPFKVIFCDITIEGREVRRWCQPLFEATGKATFGLFYCDDSGIREFLVKVTPEIGCFDNIELGPTLQREAVFSGEEDIVTQLFYQKLREHKNVVFDTMLSEEGGRFYHEENRNVIISIHKEELPKLPDDYIWSDYATLNMLTQVNNCLNIQLRNLLAVL